MTGDGYGSRPDLLPKGIRDALRSGDFELHVLDLEENRILEERSLERFALAGGSCLSWVDIPGASRISYADAISGAGAVESILVHDHPAVGDIVVFCDNLIVPSLRMSIEFARICLVEMFEEFPGFWIYDIDRGILIDCQATGDIMYGPIPGR